MINSIRSQHAQVPAKERGDEGIEPMLYTAKQAAIALGISERSLWSATFPRGPIVAIRINSRSLRYPRSALESYIAEQVAALKEVSQEA